MTSVKARKGAAKQPAVSPVAASSVAGSVSSSDSAADVDVSSVSSAVGNGPLARSQPDGSSSSGGVLSNFGQKEVVLQVLLLLPICVLAFMCRLFSVVRYESVIHEFDPWFNYRTTRYLVAEGFYEFHNW